MAIKVTADYALTKNLTALFFMITIFPSLLFQLHFLKLAFDLDLQFVITLEIKIFLIKEIF